MKLADLIDPEHVVADLRVTDKSHLLRELSARAAATLSLDQHTILEALWGREELGSTGLGKGFALPHARLPGLLKFFAFFVRLVRPIDFDSVDGRPVDLVVLLLMPANAAEQHLAALAAISRPLRDQAFVQGSRQAEGGGSVAPIVEKRLTARWPFNAEED